MTLIIKMNDNEKVFHVVRPAVNTEYIKEEFYRSVFRACSDSCVGFKGVRIDSELVIAFRVRKDLQETVKNGIQKSMEWNGFETIIEPYYD
jgi:hypothetical protein